MLKIAMSNVKYNNVFNKFIYNKRVNKFKVIFISNSKYE